MNSQAAATRLRWLSDSQRERLILSAKTACTLVLRRWRANADVSLLQVRPIQEVEAPGLSEIMWNVSSKAGALMTWRMTPDALRQLLLLPLGTTAQGAEQDSLLVKLEHDLMHALSLAIVPPTLATDLCVVRSTYDSAKSFSARHAQLQQVYELVIDGQTPCCRMALEASLVDCLAPRTVKRGGSSLVTRRIAIGKEVVTLTARLGQVDIPFKELRDLAVDDVLVLPTTLSSPVAVISSGHHVGEGLLGKHDHKRVLRMSNVASIGLSKAEKLDNRSAK